MNGDKGWRKFGDDTTELDANAVANEKRTVYLQVIEFKIIEKVDPKAFAKPE